MQKVAAPATCRRGLPETARDEAAALFLEAFAPKFRLILGEGARARRLVREALRLHRAVGAFAGERLVGLAGWQDAEGGFVDVDTGSLTRVYGDLGGLWRGLALTVFDRPEEPGVLTLNGVAVAGPMRGRGVGGLLMGEIERVARARGCARVRLDVVEGNRARTLYERSGFVAVGETRARWLGALVGFGATTRMEKRL
jgi:GNAT superfamily N-acetyltransferase